MLKMLKIVLCVINRFVWCEYLFICVKNQKSSTYTVTGSLNFPHCCIWYIRSPDNNVIVRFSDFSLAFFTSINKLHHKVESVL